jgi:hypothetical protein
MAQFNYFGSGNPTSVPSPADALANYFDTFNNALWLSSGSGWQPLTDVVAKAILSAQTSTISNLLTLSAPVSGLYRVSTYTVQATSTSGTLPVPAVAFTEADLDTSSTVNTVASGTATTGEGQSQSGSVLVNAKAGTNIVVSSAAPTSLTYNIKARIEYVG